jgi:hypothetical protein
MHNFMDPVKIKVDCIFIQKLNWPQCRINMTELIQLYIIHKLIVLVTSITHTPFADYIISQRNTHNAYQVTRVYLIGSVSSPFALKRKRFGLDNSATHPGCCIESSRSINNPHTNTMWSVTNNSKAGEENSPKTPQGLRQIHAPTKKPKGRNLVAESGECGGGKWATHKRWMDHVCAGARVASRKWALRKG